MSGSSWKAFLNVQVWFGGPSGSKGVVGSPSRKSGSGREAHLDVRKAHLDAREWSGVPPGCLEVVGRISRMSGSVLEVLPDVW